MSGNEFLRLLWARRLLLGLIPGCTILLVVLLSLIWPKTYIAEASVVIDSKTTNPVSGSEQASELMPSNIATQADVITSHNVALKVVEMLHLTSNPELQEHFRESTDGTGSIRDWIADWLVRNMEVKPARDSHVINIDVGSNNPVASAAIANAVADAYIQTSLELKMEPARRQTAWFQDQLQGLRKSLESAQRRLTEFQRSNTVMGTNDQIDIENARLAEISSQLIAAQAAMYERQTRLAQVSKASREHLQELPDLLGNLLLQGMKADLGRAEGKLAELGARFGKNHPQYLSAVAELQALQDKMAAEENTAIGAIAKSAQQSAGQAAELRRALDQQRDHILELKRQRDSLDVLKREVDSAQRVYDAGLERATQVRLESQLDQSNIGILNRAVPPFRAAWPKTLLNLLVAIVLGVVFGVATVVAAERRDGRVRSSADLVDRVGVLVLAEIPRMARVSRWRGFRPRAPASLALKA